MEPACETKPILPLRVSTDLRPAASDPAQADHAKRTQSAPDRQAGPWLERIMRNEPNFRSAGRLGTLDGAKQTQFAPGQAGANSCETNPISSSLTETQRPDCAKQSQTWVGWDIWGTAPQRGQLCKTNPIPMGLGGTELGDDRRLCETKPIPRTGGGGRGFRHVTHLPRSQLCKTNPIWPGLGRVRFPVGERCETKPIARSGAPKRCLDCGFRIADWMADLRREAGPPVCAGQNAQNEPNSCHWGRLCKTKPICPPS